MSEAEKKHFEEIGKSLMEGALYTLGKYVIISWFAIAAGVAISNQIGVGTNDSDFDGWNRSGLKLHTDAKTGVQYLSDGKGGLIEREVTR